MSVADDTLRWRWVDNAKAIGILLVVYGHAARGLHLAGLPMDEGWFQLIDDLIYSFHMALFFFLAGLFFNDSLQRRGRVGLLRAKCDTLVYPYAVWTLLQGTLEYALQNWTNRSGQWNHWQDVVAVLWHPLAHLWFLFTLFFVTQVAALCSSSLRPAHHRGLLLGSIIAFFFSNSELSRTPVLGFVMGHLVYFVIGMVVSAYQGPLLARPGRLALLALPLFAGASWLRSNWTGNDGVALEALQLVAGCSGTALVIALAARAERWSWRWMSMLGQASMEIYLAHVIAASGCRILLVRLIGIDSVPMHLLLGCGCGVVVPLLLRHWASRSAVISALFSNPWPLGGTRVTG